MKIKTIVTVLCASLVLLPAITWAMEMSEEDQIALALTASTEEQAHMANLESAHIDREEAELAEALWLSERASQQNKEQRELQEASNVLDNANAQTTNTVEKACNRCRRKCNRTLPDANNQNRSAKSIAIRKKYKQA